VGAGTLVDMTTNSHDRTHVRAVVLDVRPIGGEDGRGHPLFVVDLTVLGADAPTRMRTSVGVPPHAIRLLYAGAELVAELVATPNGPVPLLRFGDPPDA
jgi:hypothetical protein